MPFVNIRIVKEVIADDPEGIKKKISKGVADAISTAAGIDPQNIWTTFEEVPETDWFVGADRVKELRGET